YFVDLFPRPLEIGAARWDDAHLRKIVSLPLLRTQVFGNRIVQGCARTNPFGSREPRLHRALVLVDCENACGEITNQEPGNKTRQTPEEEIHGALSSAFITTTDDWDKQN